MANESAFPLYFQMVMKAGQAREQLRREVDGIGKDAQGLVNKAFGNIQQTISQAFAIPRNKLGSLDLGADQYREAERNARAYATGLREVAAASLQLAHSGDANKAELRRSAQDALALARSYEETAREAMQFAAIQDRVQAELNKTKSATDAVIAANARGTASYQTNTQSVRAMRQATAQAGQQLQDIVIQIGSGQRASVALAQQIPQLAYAFSDVGGKAGAFARVLSGPAGVLIALGAFSLGPLIDDLLGFAAGSDKAGSATANLTNKLDLTKNSYEQLIAVVQEYNSAQSKTESLTYGAILAAEKLAEANLKVAKTELQKYQSAILNGPTGPNGQGQYAPSLIVGRLESRISELEKGLLESNVAAGTERVRRKTDPRYDIEVRYDEKITRNAEQRAQNIITQVQYEERRLSLIKQQDAALKAFDESQKAAQSTSERDTRSRQQVLADFRRELEARGVETISGYRTASQQNALFRQGLTPADGYKVPSRHQSYRAVDINKATFNAQKIYEAGQAAGIRGLEIITESGGRKHLQFSGSGKPGTVDDKQAERIAAAQETARRAAEQLQNELDGISVAVTRIGGEFDRQPRFIDRATLAAQKLRVIISDIDKKLANTDITADQRKKLEADKSAAQNTLNIEIPRAVRQPFDDITKQAERELELQNLRLNGREVEAQLLQQQFDLMQRYGAENEAQLADALARSGISKEEYQTQLDLQKVLLTNRDIERERLERLGETVEDQLARLRELREAAISTIADAAYSGDLSFRNLFGTIKRQMADQFSRNLFEGILGGVFTKEEDRLRDLKNRTDGQLLDFTSKVIIAYGHLADAAQNAAAALNNSPSPANDNNSVAAQAAANDIEAGLQEIVVTARTNVNTLGRLIDNIMKRVLGPNSALAADISSTLGTAVQGIASGLFGSSLGRALGLKTSSTGGALGGAVGQVLGEKVLTKGFESIAKGLGSFAGPLGGIVGGLVGGVVGGLFKKTPRGSAIITSANDPAMVWANKSGVRDNLTGISGSLQDRLKQVADQLGGTLGNFRVSIGEYKGYYRVSGSGSSSVGDKKYPKRAGSDLLYDGQDAEEAARVALLNAIQDGAIVGLRAGAQRLLQAGKNLEQSVQKAMDFESVFTRLKAIKDPVGAAIDTLDREFGRLRTIFTEAGASVQERAQLEELYGIERANAIKEAQDRIVGSLRDLYKELTVGADSRSLSERLAFAQANYDPLAARVKAGDTTAYDEFAAAARELLGIRREFSGSQSQYFDLLNTVTELTRQTLKVSGDVTAAAINSDSPFGSSGTGTANDNGTAVVGAINQQTNLTLAALNQNNEYMRQLLLRGGIYAGGGGNSGYHLAGATYY